MTNKEILHAHLLDIIFENRNKDYGAYALRREYNHRLLMALGIASSFVLLFVLLNQSGKNDESFVPVIKSDPGIVVRTIELPKQIEKPKGPNPVKPVARPAQIKYTSDIKIKPDNLVKTTLPDIKELEGKTISTQTLPGKITDASMPVEDKPAINSGSGGPAGPSQPETQFIVDERDPEFPGGPVALQQFLARNLNSPEELQAGEQKMVQIRFKVDKDGIVSTLEIFRSGGSEFDQEVIRVCKKMPRWKPAVQNGVNVSVSYVLPITFIGAEQ